METATPRPDAFASWLEGCRPVVEAALEQALEAGSVARAPQALREAVEYALLGPGKRVRPALVLLACEAEGGARERALPAAAAVEMIHAYSLAHDDLPAMDDDHLRRGRPTLHVRFGEALAILAGDALQTLAFETLARQEDAALAREQVRILAGASGAEGMVGGQVLDLAAEGTRGSWKVVEEIHRRKTGALLGACLELGAAAAGASSASWRPFGRAVGLLFQITDDLLDATAATEALGKTAGKDAHQGKATVVGALGLPEALRRAEALAGLARERLPAAAASGPLRDLPRFLLERCR